MLYVNVADVQMWRAHWELKAWLEQGPVKSLGIAPDPILMDGQHFDPIAHFRKWRAADDVWSAGKQERIQRALARADELRNNQQVSVAKTAQILNEERLLSLTGKPWTEDSLRKQLKAREKLLL